MIAYHGECSLKEVFPRLLQGLSHPIILVLELTSWSFSSYLSHSLSQFQFSKKGNEPHMPDPNYNNGGPYWAQSSVRSEPRPALSREDDVMK